MPIVITMLFLVVFGLILVFSNRVRNIVVNCITGTGAVAAGAWRRRPTWAQVWSVARWPLIVLAALFANFAIIMIAFGFYVNAPMAAFLIVILLPVWIVLRILRAIPFLGRFFRLIMPVSWYVTSIVLVISSIYFLIGVWSPEVKASGDRFYANKKIELANKLDKGSLVSEPEMGIFGKVVEDSAVYNQQKQPFGSVDKGTFVRILDLNGQKADGSSEGLTHVMLPNKQGQFIKGNTGWVPTRVLSWDWKEKKLEPVTPKVVPVATAPIPVQSPMTSTNIQLSKGQVINYELEPGEATPWITSPTGVNYNVWFEKESVRVYYWDGRTVDMQDGKSIGLPDVCPAKFKIINKGGVRNIIKITGI